MTEADISTTPAGARDDERIAAGEDNPTDATFRPDAIGEAFGVSMNRVQNAVQGEFGRDLSHPISAIEAQHLAEVLLGDQPLDQREAALMRLGAYTPRSDDTWGLGDKAPGEQSERLSDDANKLDDQSWSKRGSYAPATDPAPSKRTR